MNTTFKLCTAEWPPVSHSLLYLKLPSFCSTVILVYTWRAEEGLKRFSRIQAKIRIQLWIQLLQLAKCENIFTHTILCLQWLKFWWPCSVSMGEKGLQGGSWFDPSSIHPLFHSQLSPSADLAVAIFLTFTGRQKDTFIMISNFIYFFEWEFMAGP